ncbi:MAG: hypothetical protein R3B90_20170 [Planctomycetaceae bacterium]
MSHHVSPAPESHGWHPTTLRRIGTTRSTGLPPLHGRLRGRLAAAPLGRAVRGWAAGRRGGRAAGPARLSELLLSQSLGWRWRDIGGRLLVLVLLKVLKDHERVLVGDRRLPTKRYGPKVQGAGIHHDHAGADRQGVLLRTRVGDAGGGAASAVGTIGLPTWLYVRAGRPSKLPKRCRWMFQTKSNKRPTWSSRCHNPAGPRQSGVVRMTAPTPSGCSRPLLKAGRDACRPAPQGTPAHDLPPVQKTNAAAAHGRTV